MNENQNTTTTETTLTERYEALPTAKKLLLGKMVCAYAMTLHQVRASINLPDDGLTNSISSFMASLEPKS